MNNTHFYHPTYLARKAELDAILPLVRDMPALQKSWAVWEKSNMIRDVSDARWLGNYQEGFFGDSAKKAILHAIKLGFEYQHFIALRAKRRKADDIVFVQDGKAYSRWEYREYLLQRCYRKYLSQNFEECANQAVWIFSREYGAYWRSGAAGYTNDIQQAGIYSVQEAYDLTRHTGHTKGIYFFAVYE